MNESDFVSFITLYLRAPKVVVWVLLERDDVKSGARHCAQVLLGVTIAAQREE